MKDTAHDLLPQFLWLYEGWHYHPLVCQVELFIFPLRLVDQCLLALRPPSKTFTL